MPTAGWLRKSLPTEGEWDGWASSNWSREAPNGHRLSGVPYHGAPQITWCLTRYGGAAFGLAVVAIVGTRCRTVMAGVIGRLASSSSSPLSPLVRGGDNREW